MIIIGYQGIDKSTYCRKMIDAIDLDDSSCFRDFSGNRPDKSLKHDESSKSIASIIFLQYVDLSIP